MGEAERGVFVVAPPPTLIPVAVTAWLPSAAAGFTWIAISLGVASQVRLPWPQYLGQLGTLNTFTASISAGGLLAWDRSLFVAQVIACLGSAVAPGVVPRCPRALAVR